MLVGDSSGIKQNNFLATDASYGDFILKFSVRLANDSGNSGVQFRSVRVPGHEMSGYQADIGPGYWGSLYDESRRNRVLKPAAPKALEALHKGDWNHYVIRVMGDEITLSLNGVESARYTETDSGIARDGRIAVQIHAGGPMKVEFKDIYIQPLPSPKAQANANTPGFHLRTVKTPMGDRKYTLFVPNGYDGSKAFPAVLFLHGSGERGEDGIKGGQIGLGASVLAHPDRFPAAGYPATGLEDVAGRFRRRRGGRPRRAGRRDGDIQGRPPSDQPDRPFDGRRRDLVDRHDLTPTSSRRSAPICGRGRPESVEVVKGLPTWIVVGDEGWPRHRPERQGRWPHQALRDAGHTTPSRPNIGPSATIAGTGPITTRSWSNG